MPESERKLGRKWHWMMDYCLQNNLPPAQKWCWDLAEKEYINKMKMLAHEEEIYSRSQAKPQR